MFVPPQIIGKTCNGTRQIALTTLVIKLAKLVWVGWGVGGKVVLTEHQLS